MTTQQLLDEGAALHQAADELHDRIDKLKAAIDQNSGLQQDETLHLARGVCSHLKGILGAHLADGLPRACKAIAAKVSRSAAVPAAVAGVPPETSSN